MRFSLRNAKLRTKMVGGFLIVVALTLVALVAALALAGSRGGSERERA